MKKLTMLVILSTTLVSNGLFADTSKLDAKDKPVENTETRSENSNDVKEGKVSDVKAATKQDDAHSIMEQVLDRYVGHTEVSTISLVTCPYREKKGSIACASQPRKKAVQAVSKNYGEKLKDSRGLMLIVEPISEYGIGILQYDYIKSGQEADQWLYLPELDRVKRVASSNDAPKKGSLFGSEFSLEDMERQKIEDYSYKILREEKVAGRDAYVIENTPTEARALKTNYLRRIQWVDKERLLVLKEEFYEWNGELFKVSYSSNIKLVNGIWTAKKQVMRNLKSKRVSMLLYKNIAYNLEINDDVLTTRVLSDVVFREKFIKSLQKERNEIRSKSEVSKVD